AWGVPVIRELGVEVGKVRDERDVRERPRDAIELEALMTKVSCVTDGEARAVVAAVLEAPDVHPVEGDIRGQRMVEPARLGAELPVRGRFTPEHTPFRVEFQSARGCGRRHG